MPPRDRPWPLDALPCEQFFRPLAALTASFNCSILRLLSERRNAALVTHGPLAHQAEHLPFKENVAGSSPARPTREGPAQVCGAILMTAFGLPHGFKSGRLGPVFLRVPEDGEFT